MLISSLHIYPVKSCRRIDLDSVQAEPWGLAGDRRWMLVSENNGFLTQRDAPKLALVTAIPTPDGGLRLSAPGRPEVVVGLSPGRERIAVPTRLCTLEVIKADELAAEWFTGLVERPVNLVWLADPTQRPVDPDYGHPADRVNLSDCYPVHLVTEASLDALNAQLAASGELDEMPVPLTKLRPNLVVSGADPWMEDAWVGGRIRVGGVPFRVVTGTGRCVLSTIDQETAVKGHEPLRILARHRTIDQQLLFGVYLIPDGTGTVRVGDPVEVIEGPRSDDGRRTPVATQP
jgi:uncharacterized protein YcbX